MTQHELKDYKAALQSHQDALQIRLKLFSEDHPDTAQSYNEIGATQYAMNYNMRQLLRPINVLFKLD